MDSASDMEFGGPRKLGSRAPTGEPEAPPGNDDPRLSGFAPGAQWKTRPPRRPGASASGRRAGVPPASEVERNHGRGRKGGSVVGGGQAVAEASGAGNARSGRDGRAPAARVSGTRISERHPPPPGVLDPPQFRLRPGPDLRHSPSVNPATRIPTPVCPWIPTTTSAVRTLVRVAAKWILPLVGLLLPAFPAEAALRAGAAAVDITPTNLPVLVNGGMLSRSVGRVKTRLHARAVVLADDRIGIALVVVDSCMMGRPLLDEAKSLAAVRTGIAPHRMLISATHAHSVPSAFACLGTEADAGYVPYLRDRIVEAIAAAQANLEPARVGFARAGAPEFTALRRWIRRPDRLAEDPFGNPTVRANMHAGANWDDVTGESGPEDPDLALISVQAADGRPLAVLGNFSMHYFGDDDLSADYFGLFSEGLRQHLAPEPVPGRPPFVGILSHGCSGDIWRRDYTRPAGEWNPKLRIEDYTEGLLAVARQALSQVEYRSDADLAMAERRFTLSYRVPDQQRLEWARRIVATLEGREPRTTTEVYAREQILLHERRRTEVVVQALRIGEIGVASTPTETYALTGLKIKAASPLPASLVVELANGGDGYIPPPEQHLLGGYNTWPARSAGLEIQAEPRIAEAAIALLEEVSGKPRRPFVSGEGPAALALRELRPLAWWRLDEFGGPHAPDFSGHRRDAIYEPAIAFHLEGPHSPAFQGPGRLNRAPHFVGGRLRARLPELGARYSVALWLWNGLPTDARSLAGWCFSRERDHALSPWGDHLGVAGTHGTPGCLVFQHGRDSATATFGRTAIPRWEWHHATLVRDADRIRVYLDGRLEIETRLPDGPGTEVPPGFDQVFFGGRSDGEDGWEGRLDETAVFDRALTADEVARLQPR
jgi:hypothetical protein